MKKIQTEKEFRKRCDWCLQQEPKLKPVIDKYGYPPFWHRTPNFATLILTILEQQVSLASAKAAFNKLEARVELLTPLNLLKLSDEELQTCGFSRQKIRYSRILATEIAENRLDLDALNTKSETEIRETLIKLKGIGNWTIDMYLLMSLNFSDIFPPGDLATIKSVYELGLAPSATSKEDIIEYMKRFSPNRSVATYFLWHAYIQRRNLNLE